MEFIKQTPQHTYLIRLLRGEDLLLSLQKFCEAHSEFGAGSIQGIGAVSEAKIGYFDGSKYLEIHLEENLEMLSLLGNIASNNIVHLHGIFSRADGTCLGGHILPGCIISVTGEIHFNVFKPPVIREVDPSTNLQLLKLPEELI